jgi:hypothetical protein
MSASASASTSNDSQGFDSTEYYSQYWIDPDVSPPAPFKGEGDAEETFMNVDNSDLIIDSNDNKRGPRGI